MGDAAFNADVARTKQIYAELGGWIEKYRGGVPAGFAAAAIKHESNGQFGAAGDATLGEIGYFQVAAYVPPLFGLAAATRADPETNVFLGLMEYQLEAAYWKRDYPNHIRLGSADSWKLARLSFAIGRPGSRTLTGAVSAAGSLVPGDVYGSLSRYVQNYGGIPLGSQSADKVKQRVIAIQRTWDVGQAAKPGSPGVPTYTPAPPAGPYSIPANAAPYFSKPVSGMLVLGGGLALLLLIKGFL